MLATMPQPCPRAGGRACVQPRGGGMRGWEQREERERWIGWKRGGNHGFKGSDPPAAWTEYNITVVLDYDYILCSALQYNTVQLSQRRRKQRRRKERIRLFVVVVVFDLFNY